MELDFLKECFESEENFNNFSKQIEEKGIKLVDVSTGDYVSKAKYTDETKKLKDMKAKYEELEKNISTDDGAKQKMADMETQLKDWQTKYATLEEDYNHTNKRNLIVKSGIKEEFADFVYSEVKKKVTDEVDFDTAFKKFKAENTQYNSENVKPRAGVNPNLSGTNTTQENTNKLMNDIIRGIE